MLPTWSYSWGGPACQGVFKQQCEDFVVYEDLGFEPEGHGEHVFLYIEKRDSNTAWVADRLAEFAGVGSVAIGVSGLKDRQAITRQWFSVALHPSKEPDWQQFNSNNISVLQVSRHPRKLKRGVHRANKFIIRLRQIRGERDKLNAQIEAIKNKGFANYFGEQRFGHNGKNIAMAQTMFAGKRVKRQQRSHYLSAARSLLFNELLSHRIGAGDWLTCQSGEVLMLAGTHSLFDGYDDLPILQQRLDNADIHLTGPMWGRGQSRATQQVAALEEVLRQQYPDLCDGLEKAGLQQERRALREIPKQVEYTWSGDDLRLEFSLSRGAYATAFLRELVVWSEFVAT